jgi:hypothetical protein
VCRDFESTWNDRPGLARDWARSERSDDETEGRIDVGLLSLPVRAVTALFGLVFSLAIVEFLGLLFYGAVTDKQAAQALMNNTTDPMAFPGRWVEYVLASPDRTLVALVLAAIVALLALSSSGTESREVERPF